MKRSLIVAVSAAFFAAYWLGRMLSRLIGSRGAARCTVIYYHAVPDAHRARFAAQMDAVKRYAKVVPAGQIAPLDRGTPCVAVTFDDAYRDIIANALPALRTRGIHSTIFVVPELLGKTMESYDSSVATPEDRLIMSAEEMKALRGDLVAIGSHSLTHSMLPMLGPREAMHELSESRRVLEETLGEPVRLFCFPYGGYTEPLIRWCREAGYQRVFTTLPGWGLSAPDEFVTGRVRVDPTDGWLEFRLKIRGAYRWLPVAFAMKKKLLPGRGHAAPQTAA